MFWLSLLKIFSNKSDLVLLFVYLRNALQDFNPEKFKMSFYLILFERQMNLLKVSTYKWVAYLTATLPNETGNLIF